MTEFAGWFATQAGVLDPGTAVAHWGYVAVFVLVVLGNAGVPVPEETVLVEPLRHIVGSVEHAALGLVVAAAAAVLGWRVIQAARGRRR